MPKSVLLLSFKVMATDKYDIEKLPGCYACLYNPHLVDRMKELKNFEEFKAPLPPSLPYLCVARYVVLLYDMHSPIREIERRINVRKKIAALYAGFTLGPSGKFSPDVEDMVMGNYPEINSMIVRYIMLQNSPLFSKLVAYESIFHFEIIKSQSGNYGKAKDIIDSINQLSTAISDMTDEIFAGKGESRLILEEFYKKISEGVDISCEAVSDYIEKDGNVPESWGIYGDGYKIDDLKFVDDK